MVYKLDIDAEDYLKPKESIIGYDNDNNFFVGFTYPKSKKQIDYETEYYVKLLSEKKIKQIPHIKNYLNAYTYYKNKSFKIITENDDEFSKQNFRYKLTPRDTTLSTDIIKKLLLKEEIKIDEKELYNKIITQLKKYVYLRQPEEYDVVALYIILSYVYLMLDFTPILHLNGEAGTGKSQLGKIISKISSNSSATVSATKSSFFRRIDRKRGLYFMDEKEHLEEYEKELLNGCTYEGNIHTVTEKKGDEFIETEFQIYAPVVLACIGEIYGATSTRTIKIETIKAPRDSKKYKVIRLSEDNNIWKTIRDETIIYWLQNHDKINGLMNLTEEIESIISNRGVDAWKTIINLSEIFDRKTNIINYITNYYLDQVEEHHEQDVDMKFYLYLHSIGNRDWLLAEDIYLEFIKINLTDKQREYFTKTRFGKCMRRIGYSKNALNKKRVGEGYVYRLEKEVVTKYIIDTYDFGEQLLSKSDTSINYDENIIEEVVM